MLNYPVCPFCDKEMLEKESKFMNEQGEHENKWWECNNCGAAFDSWGNEVE